MVSEKMLLGKDEMMRVSAYFRTFFQGQRAERGSRAADSVAGTFGRMHPDSSTLLIADQCRCCS